MISLRWKAAVVLVGVFLSGAVSGAALTAVAARRALTAMMDRPLDEAREWALVFRMDRAVGLRPGQEEAVRTILRRHRQELARVREAVQPALREVRARQWDEVRGVLTEAQRPRFDALVADWEARARERARMP